MDRCWKDPEFQDLDGKIGRLAEMVPIRALDEASGSYIDLEEVTADIRRASLLDEAAGRGVDLLS